jgi:hypothetical protein
MDWTQFTPEIFHSAKHKAVQDAYHDAQRTIISNAQKLQEWRNTCDKEIQNFENTVGLTSLGFPPMDKVMRYIVHEAANARNLASYSFGPETQRYTVVYKKGSEPAPELLEKWRAVTELPSQPNPPAENI